MPSLLLVAVVEVDEVRRGDPAAASAGDSPPPNLVVDIDVVVLSSLSTVNKAVAIVLTDAKVLLCCIMS